MPPIGHIELDGRPYKLVDPTQYRVYSANQMAPKLSAAGASEYGDMTQWDNWVVSDWQTGIGQPAEASGMHYAEADSRIPGRLQLPARLHFYSRQAPDNSTADCRWAPAAVEYVLVVGGDVAAPYQKLRFAFEPQGGGPLQRFWLYARIPSEVTVIWELYAEAGGDPLGTLLADGALVSVAEDKAFRWVGGAAQSALSPAGRCTLVVYPANEGEAFEVAFGAVPVRGDPETCAWGVYDPALPAGWHPLEGYPFYLTDAFALEGGLEVFDVTTFNGKTYLADGNRLYALNESTGCFELVASTPERILDLQVWGDRLYIGHLSVNYQTMNTAETLADGGSAGQIFYSSGLYLWKAVNNCVYYSADGNAWIGPIPCGPSNVRVTGISEYNEFIYAATTDGLFVIMDGDKAKGITPWGALDRNVYAHSLITHNATLYSRTLGQCLQHQAAGVRNIWSTVRKDELPSLAAGEVYSLCATVNWPVILVRSRLPEGHDTVWAWQDEGWHHLATLPNYLRGSCVRYERRLSSLWIGTNAGLVLRIHLPDYLKDPLLDPEMEYMPFGWYETGWFAGGVYEEEKDPESVYLRGRDLGSLHYVDCYWQDDQSTGWVEFAVDDEDLWVDDDGEIVGDEFDEWFYLGRFESDQQELIFGVDNDTRPATREIRLGLLLAGDGTSTPRVYAHRLKYQLMIQDWSGWTLPIEVSGSAEQPQELMEGTLNPYDRDEQRAHLDSLRRRTAPFTFTDIDGQQYPVKAREYSFTPHKVEHYNGKTHFDGVYLLTIEEARVRQTTQTA